MRRSREDDLAVPPEPEADAVLDQEVDELRSGDQHQPRECGGVLAGERFAEFLLITTSDFTRETARLPSGLPPSFP